VVDDGSTDATVERARATGAQVLMLSPNRGKGAAVQAGLGTTAGQLVLLLDADLVGLSPSHILALLEPVQAGHAASVGLFTGGRWNTTLASWLTRRWSGQRAFRRETIAGSEFSTLRYEVELAIEAAWKAAGVRAKYVHLPDLTHLTKEEKLGPAAGGRARVRMFQQLVRYAFRRPR